MSAEKKKSFMNITNDTFHFCREDTFQTKRLFVCVKTTVSDAYLAPSHLPAPIILSAAPFILMSVFVYFASPAYFLSNDTPQRGSSCAVFPINTQAYFRSEVRAG